MKAMPVRLINKRKTWNQPSFITRLKHQTEAGVDGNCCVCGWSTELYYGKKHLMFWLNSWTMPLDAMYNINLSGEHHNYMWIGQLKRGKTVNLRKKNEDSILKEFLIDGIQRL